MKNSILGLLLMTFVSTLYAASDYEFIPEYRFFTHKAAAYEIKDITVKTRRGSRVVKRSKGISFKVDGSVASCSGLRFRELFPKLKVKVTSCHSNELKVSIKYLRVAACDQALIHDGKKIKVKLPKDCKFSADSGNVVIDNE